MSKSSFGSPHYARKVVAAAGGDGKPTAMGLGRCWDPCSPLVLGASVFFPALQPGLGLKGLASRGAWILWIRSDLGGLGGDFAYLPGRGDA